MKVTQENLSKEFHESGAWSDVPLDELFRTTARENPSRLALVDAPDRSDWTGGAPRQLSYAEADAEIDRLAAFYGTIGLSADHVIGVQAPNTVDTVIAILAALRAGLIVSPLPLHWRQKNVLDALNSIGARVSSPRIAWKHAKSASQHAMLPPICLPFGSSLASAQRARRPDRTWAHAV